MKNLVDSLTQILQQFAKKSGPEAQVIQGPPCSNSEIGKLEGKIGWKLPEDYKDFLRVANGLSLRDGTEPFLINFFPASELPLKIDDNQKETLGEDGETDLSNILIIANVEMNNIYVFFDKSTGETVSWANFDSSRFASFTKYLEAQTAALREEVASD
jgi:hypothetical protein